jgi:hypothetical protein
MARKTRKTPKPNGPKLSKSKKTMKQKGGGDDVHIVQYGPSGRKDTTTVPANTLQDIVDSINISMENFNARIGRYESLEEQGKFLRY